MPKQYEWKRLAAMPVPGTGIVWEYALTTSPDKPPDDTGNWQRVYHVGIGAVDGAGGSPARPVRKRDGNSGTT